MRYLRLLDTVFIGTLILVTALSATARPAHAADDTALWSAIRTGTAFAIMRHALAPGTGDPETVVIGDCTTQRNLSGDGRAQSREIGGPRIHQRLVPLRGNRGASEDRRGNGIAAPQFLFRRAGKQDTADGGA